MPPHPAGGDLLLVGAGHAHLHLIARADDLREAGYAVRLLAPAAFRYSGVASATAAGDLPPSTGEVDVAALAARHGVEHVVGTLATLDLRARRAGTDAGRPLSYDVLCLNLGSVVAPHGIDVGPGVLRVKPLDDLVALAARLHEVADRDGRGAVVDVVGGGSTGLELAAHLAVRPDVALVRLVEGGGAIGADLPPRAARRLGRLLAARGVEVRTGTAVRQLTREETVLADGRRLTHDVALLATGLRAPDLLAATGLGDERGVPVRATLQHRDHDEVLAAGDCARFLPGPLPRVGVHGVRQGPVLLAGLLARARGEPLPRYEPPRRALAVLDLGDGDALAVRGRWWWHGRLALRLKRRIDARWLRRYQGGT